MAKVLYIYLFVCLSEVAILLPKLHMVTVQCFNLCCHLSLSYIAVMQ